MKRGASPLLDTLFLFAPDRNFIGSVLPRCIPVKGWVRSLHNTLKIKLWYNEGMTVILRIIEVVLGLLALATISVVVFLRRPDWSPFQEQTFGSNVIPVAMMVAAWTTLLVAYAAFRTIRSNREKEERDRKERRLNEIIEWATDVLRCGNDINIMPIATLKTGSIEELRFLFVFGGTLFASFRSVEASGKFARSIVNNYFGQEQKLREAVGDLVTGLETHLELIERLNRLYDRQVELWYVLNTVESVAKTEPNDIVSKQAEYKNNNAAIKTLSQKDIRKHKRDKLDPLATAVIDEVTKVPPQ